jgi:hypothetical protein
MMAYTAALERRGFPVRMGDSGKLIIHKDTPAHLVRQIREHRDEIVAELLGEGTRAQTLDPRPDLADDHAQWLRLLLAAWGSPLFGPLHGFRCCGARLRKSITGMHITYDPTQPGFANQAEFNAACKEWLMPDSTFTGRLDAELTRLMHGLEAA